MEVEKATLEDAPQIQRLVNFWADRGEMLHRSLSEIYENLRDYWVMRSGQDLVACAAFHIYWSDLAEIRALAVREEDQA
ncbi:MAG: GNAT family N-acetyltransferase, partial [Dehalococcoidia bacterium]|nr:GNAT family N-acetyltransferase [Dehalococcoidia bacterium]